MPPQPETAPTSQDVGIPRPQPLRPSVWSSLWQNVVRFQADKVTPWIALRNTLGITLPLAIGVATGAVQVGLAVATGALNVSYSDSHDSYRPRAYKMLAASILVGLAVFAGALCGRNPWIAVAVAALGAFAAGLAVALSATAADLGVITIVVIVVYAASPQTPERAAYAGLLAFGGGLFQTALALAFWPLRRYRPERHALGTLYLELSRAASSPVRVGAAPPASAESTQAQTSLSALDRDHSVEAERYRMLLSQAERIRLRLLMLGRLRVRLEREAPASEEARLFDRYFELSAALLHEIGASLSGAGSTGPAAETLKPLQDIGEALRQAKDRLPPPAAALVLDARSQMDALTGQLRSAVDLAAYSGDTGQQAFEQREARKPRRLRTGGTLATLRANLSFDSAAFRHAVRLAVCVGLGYGLARGLETPRSYWIPMTIAIVLKPDFTGTFSRGLLRFAGTLAGLVFSTLMFHLMPPGLGVQVALIAALMYVLRWIGSANYGIFTALVTALVVLLIAFTGVAPERVMLARGLNTLIGGTIALIAYGLWPTWERRQAPEAMAQMLDAYRIYFRAIRESYLRPNTVQPSEVDRARLAARRSRSNLESSIDRLTTEPGSSAATLKLLGGMLASSHRLVHALMALEAGLESSHPVPARGPFIPFATDVELTLFYLASGLRGSPLEATHLPDLREDHHRLVNSGDALTERYALVNVETDRITNSLNTLSEEVLHWTSSRSRFQSSSTSDAEAAPP